jgi:hypothetical protein
VQEAREAPTEHPQWEFEVLALLYWYEFWCTTPMVVCSFNILWMTTGTY